METYPSLKSIALTCFILFMSTAFIGFELYEEIICYQDLLQQNNDKLRIAWKTFGIIGVSLSALSLLDSLLLGLLWTVCKRFCSTQQPRKKMEKKEYKLVAAESDEDDLKSNSRRYKRQPKGCGVGCNDSTRNDFMGSLTIWFQDIPLLIMYIIAFYNNSETSESSEVTDSTNSITILPRQQSHFLLSVILAMVWRFLLTIIRHVKRWSASDKRDVIYPPGTHIGKCYCKIVCSMLVSLVAVIGLTIANLFIHKL